MSEAGRSPEILASLAALVGPSHVVTDPDLIAAHLIEPRGLYQGRALALVRPVSTEQTARVVALCHDRRVRWCRRAATPDWSAARRPTPAEPRSSFRCSG